MLNTVSRKAFGFLAFLAAGSAAAANGLAHSATPPAGAADAATILFLAALCLAMTWVGFLLGRDYAAEDARRETRRASRIGRRAVAAALAEIEAEEAAELAAAPVVNVMGAAVPTSPNGWPVGTESWTAKAAPVETFRTECEDDSWTFHAGANALGAARDKARTVSRARSTNAFVVRLLDGAAVGHAVYCDGRLDDVDGAFPSVRVRRPRS